MAVKVKKANIAMVVIFLIAGFIGYQFIYLGSQKGLGELKGKLAEVKERNELLAKASVLSRLYGSAEGRLGREKDEIRLVSMIHAIAGKAGVKILSTDPLPRSQIGDYAKVAVKIEAQCGYHELGEFVGRLESSEDFLKVEAMTAQIEEGARGEVLSEAQAERVPGVTMTIASFFRRRAR